MLETVVNLCRVMAVAASVVGSISSIVFAQGKLSDVDAIRFQGGTQHAIPVEQQLVVEVSLKDVNVQVRAFRARQADLKTGWACDDTKDGCVICDSVVIFPQGGNWKLEFPKFDLSWLRPDGPDRVGDGVTFLRLEPVGFRPDGPIKLKRSELEAYFRFGVEVVLKVPGSMSGVDAKELNERIQGLFDLRGQEYLLPRKASTCAALVAELHDRREIVVAEGCSERPWEVF